MTFCRILFPLTAKGFTKVIDTTSCPQHLNLLQGFFSFEQYAIDIERHRQEFDPPEGEGEGGLTSWAVPVGPIPAYADTLGWSLLSSRSEALLPSWRPARPTAVIPLPAAAVALPSLLEMEALTPDRGMPAI